MLRFLLSTSSASVSEANMALGFGQTHLRAITTAAAKTAPKTAQTVAKPAAKVAKEIKSEAQSIKTVKAAEPEPKMKRSLSAVNLFIKENAARLKQEFGPLSIVVQGNVAWKKLNERDRQPYIEKAEMLKAVAKEQQLQLASKRPRSAYQAFLKDTVQSLKAADPTRPKHDVWVEAMQKWQKSKEVQK
ncbi:hypothetical protein QJQ45_014446 [Haematococcus lacustris]|nr:hypothetical protein QJQ45_014446 [Haematococcus lacustris]